MSKRKIETADDYIGEAVEILERYLQTFTEANGLIREGDENDSGEFTFYYTTRGSKLAARMIGRLSRLGERLFPNDDIEIETYLYQES